MSNNDYCNYCTDKLDNNFVEGDSGQRYCNASCRDNGENQTITCDNCGQVISGHYSTMLNEDIWCELCESTIQD